MFGIHMPKCVTNVAHAVTHATEVSFKEVMKIEKGAANAVSHMSPSEIGHTVLDGVGMVPVVGTAANLANAGWYAASGDWKDAGMSAAAAIPIGGEAIDAAKLGRDGVKIAEDGIKAEHIASAASEDAHVVAKTTSEGAQAMDRGAKKAVDKATTAIERAADKSAKVVDKKTAKAADKAISKSEKAVAKAQKAVDKAASKSEQAAVSKGDRVKGAVAVVDELLNSDAGNALPTSLPIATKVVRYVNENGGVSFILDGVKNGGNAMKNSILKALGNIY